MTKERLSILSKILSCIAHARERDSVFIRILLKKKH